MNKKSAIALATVAALIIVLAMVGWRTWQHRHPAEIVYQGNVDVRQVSLAFNNADRVAEVLAQEGDTVAVGQVLARLDTRTLQLQLTQARAQAAAQASNAEKLRHGARPEEIAQAQANVQAAQANARQAAQYLARANSANLASGGQAVSAVEIEAAQARNAAAQAQLQVAQKTDQLTRIGARVEDKSAAQAQSDAAQAQVTLLTQKLADAELKSPVAGVVRARLLEVGDMASPQRAAFEIALTQPKWVRIYVPETALSTIHAGMDAQIQADGAPNTQITGKVGYISSVAEFTPKTVQTEDLRSQLVYEVRIVVDDAADALHLGMPVTVRLRPIAQP